MGILSSIAGRFAIPVVLIAAVGIAIVFFRDPLVAGARALGTTTAQVISSPFTGFINTIGQAFSGLQDIDIRVPGVNVDFGIGSITGTDPFSQFFNLIFGGAGGGGGGGTTQTMMDQNGFDSPTNVVDPDDPNQDPTLFQPPGAEPTPALFGGAFAQEFRIETSEGFQTLSFEELQATQPGTIIGIFDVLGTKKTEFLPFTVSQVQSSLEAGQRLRLSAQVFQDIRGIRNVQDLFA